jgi:hypothetical protein
MTRSATILGLACLLASAPGPVRGGEGGARDLAARVLDAAPRGPFVADLTLLTTGDLERKLTMSGRRTEDGGALRYIEVTAPFNLAGTRYLLFERAGGRDEQFLHVPTMQRVMRLSDATRREPFLGSTFYILDLIQPALDDFTYAFAGDDETVRDRPCRLVEAKPKAPDREFYGRSIFAIDPVDLVVVRVELFDAEGRLHKVLHVDALERHEGYWTATRQRMVTTDPPETSTLVVERIDYDATLPDETFTIGHLGR